MSAPGTVFPCPPTVHCYCNNSESSLVAIEEDELLLEKFLDGDVLLAGPGAAVDDAVLCAHNTGVLAGQTAVQLALQIKLRYEQFT